MPTKEERSAIRREKREMRKTLRKERKTGYNAIVTAAGKTNITIDLDKAEPKFVDAFNQVFMYSRESQKSLILTRHINF